MNFNLTTLQYLPQNEPHRSTNCLPQNLQGSLSSLLSIPIRSQSQFIHHSPPQQTEIHSYLNMITSELHKKQKIMSSGPNMLQQVAAQHLLPALNVASSNYHFPVSEGPRNLNASKISAESLTHTHMGQLIQQPILNLDLETQITGQIRVDPCISTLQMLGMLHNQQKMASARLVVAKPQMIRNSIQIQYPSISQEDKLNNLFQTLGGFNERKSQDQTGLISLLLGMKERDQMLRMLEIDRAQIESEANEIPNLKSEEKKKGNILIAQIKKVKPFTKKTKKRKQGKKNWVPETPDSVSFKQFHTDAENLFPGSKFEITRVMKLLEKSSWNKIKAIENIKKNRVYYKKFLEGLTGF